MAYDNFDKLQLWFIMMLIKFILKILSLQPGENGTNNLLCVYIKK